MKRAADLQRLDQCRGQTGEDHGLYERGCRPFPGRPQRLGQHTHTLRMHKLAVTLVSNGLSTLSASSAVEAKQVRHPRHLAVAE